VLVNTVTAVKHTGLFARNAAIPDIGSDPKFSEAAFQLPSVGQHQPGTVEGKLQVFTCCACQRENCLSRRLLKPRKTASEVCSFGKSREP
jgi:hypothetical protein